MPARPRPRAPPPQPLSLPEFEPALPPLPPSPSPLENQPTPPSASSSSSSFINIPASIRPSLPSSASYDSTRSADEEPTPWGGSMSSASSPPPLRGLASKFASMMGRAQAVAGGEDGFQNSLSSDEIVRLAEEERDRSRREAEMVLEAEREEQEGRGVGGGGGTIKASKVSKKERGPFFDATNSPSPRPSPNSINLNPLESQTPTRSKSTNSQLTPGPLHPSPYLIPRNPSSPEGIDVEASLSLLANRFTKLEAWAVGHVRALEERVDKMEGRVKAVEERGGEVGKLGRDLGELRGAMRAGFEAMEGMVSTTAPPPHAPAATRAPSLDRVKEEKSRSPAAASTPPLAVKRSVLTPPIVALTTPTTTPSSSKPRTFAPVTTTAPLRTSHRSTVSISSIPHPASTQSFTSSSSPRTPQSSTPTTNILHTPTLTVPRSTSPLLPSNSAPTSPGALPPRKRYTTALGERASSSTSNLPLLNNIPASSPSSTLDQSSSSTNNTENGSGTSRSTPLPSAPFAKPTRSATGLLGGGGGSKVGRRRSRSVGGHGDQEKEEEGIIKASNLKRAQVGSLIGFWDKS